MSTSNNGDRRIRRSIAEPIRSGLNWTELWRGPDEGLIWCWERGRQYRTEDPERAAAAERGELVMDGWRGGVRERLKGNQVKRNGTLQYLATWQGMRGEDLDVCLDVVTVLVCSRTGQVVEYRPREMAIEEGEEIALE